MTSVLSKLSAEHTCSPCERFLSGSIETTVSSFTNLPVTSFERRQEAPSNKSLSGKKGSFKRASKALLLGAYKRLGCMRLHESVRAKIRPPHMTILLFHRVTDQISPDGLTVGTRWFRN